MKDQERDCQHCSHYVWQEAGFYMCEKWNCEFEPEIGSVEQAQRSDKK